MSKRYYLCPVLAPGDVGPYDQTARGATPLRDQYRPRIPRGVSWACLLPHKADGTPRFGWGLVHVSAADHSALLADAAIQALPNLAPDAAVTQNQKNALAAKVQSAFGLDLTGALAAAVTFRDVLNVLGRAINPDFDASNWGVS